MLKKIGVLILGGIVFFTGTILAETTLEKIKKTGKLKIASNLEYRPFEYFDSDKNDIVGFDIDLARLIAQYIGIEAEIINTAWDGIIPGLLSKQYDIIISAMTITEERLKTVQFSHPYYDAGQIMVVRKDYQDIQKQDDMKGKKVGVQLGTTGDFAVSKIEGADIVRYDTIDLALEALQNNNIEVVVSDAPTMAASVKAREYLKLTGPVFTTEQYGMAMRKEDVDLRNAVNDALAKVMESGQLNTLKEKWTGGL